MPSTAAAPVHTWPPLLQEAALRAYYITEDPHNFDLQVLPAPAQAGETGARGKSRSGGSAEEEGSQGPGSLEAVSEAWIIRALPRPQEVLKIYPAWLK